MNFANFLEFVQNDIYLDKTINFRTYFNCTEATIICPTNNTKTVNRLAWIIDI